MTAYNPSEDRLSDDPIHPGMTSEFTLLAQTDAHGTRAVMFGMEHISGEALVSSVAWMVVAVVDPDAIQGLSQYLMAELLGVEKMESLRNSDADISDMMSEPTKVSKMCANVSLRPDLEYFGHMFFAGMDEMVDIAALRSILGNQSVMLRTIGSAIKDAENFGAPQECIDACKSLLEALLSGLPPERVITMAEVIVSDLENNIPIAAEMFNNIPEAELHTYPTFEDAGEHIARHSSHNNDNSRVIPLEKARAAKAEKQAAVVDEDYEDLNWD